MRLHKFRFARLRINNYNVLPNIHAKYPTHQPHHLKTATTTKTTTTTQHSHSHSHPKPLYLHFNHLIHSNNSTNSTTNNNNNNNSNHNTSNENVDTDSNPNSTNTNNNNNNENTTNANNNTNNNETEKSKDKIDKRAYPIALSSMLIGTAIGIVIPLMPAFATDIGINTLQYGLVISVMGWTRLLFNIPSAYCADRYGRRPLLIGGPFLTSIGMGLTSTVESLYGLMGWRFVVGAGGSMQMAGAQTYLADISSPSNRARTMAPMQLGFSAGMALGPAIGGFLADILSVRQTFLITGMAIFGACLNNAIMCPETKPKSLDIDIKDSDVGMLGLIKNTLTEWTDILKERYKISFTIIVHCTLYNILHKC